MGKEDMLFLLSVITITGIIVLRNTYMQPNNNSGKDDMEFDIICNHYSRKIQERTERKGKGK